MAKMAFILGGTFKISDTRRPSPYDIDDGPDDKVTSGFDYRPEIENIALHNVRVNFVDPRSFIRISQRVSEILKVPPKMNAI